MTNAANLLAVTPGFPLPTNFVKAVMNKTPAWILKRAEGAVEGAGIGELKPKKRGLQNELLCRAQFLSKRPTEPFSPHRHLALNLNSPHISPR